jgi:hypothetical protein
MRPEVYWLGLPGSGRLAIMPRAAPRAADWLGLASRQFLPFRLLFGEHCFGFVSASARLRRSLCYYAMPCGDFRMGFDAQSC